VEAKKNAQDETASCNLKTVFSASTFAILQYLKKQYLPNETEQMHLVLSSTFLIN
jgi:hypothetical protein